MTYYRFSNSTNPMSEWGHAMFSEKRESVEHYGKNEFIYNGNHGVKIEELEASIISQWEKTVETGMAPMGYEEMEAQTVFQSFNPSDIVMSAEAWDSSELLTWFCEAIAIPQDIQAVITNDGAIVFDSALIRE